MLLKTGGTSALAEQPGKSQIFINELSTTNSMIQEHEKARFEEIDVDTVDNVRVRLGIDTIDLLKIDAEGFDLQVLRGAVKSLDAGKISFVLVEAGFSGTNKRHVPFNQIDAFMKQHGLELIGFHDHTPEWSGEFRLRFANVLNAQADVAAVKPQSW